MRKIVGSKPSRSNQRLLVYCFSTKHIVLKSMRKDWLARNQGSISQKVVSLRLIVSVISKLLIGWNSHLRLILDLRLFVKSTTGYYALVLELFPCLHGQVTHIDYYCNNGSFLSYSYCLLQNKLVLRVFTGKTSHVLQIEGNCNVEKIDKNSIVLAID